MNKLCEKSGKKVALREGSYHWPSHSKVKGRPYLHTFDFRAIWPKGMEVRPPLRTFILLTFMLFCPRSVKVFEYPSASLL